MCTPWTRRDWATCFMTCKFPLVPKGSVVFHSANDSAKKKKRRSPRDDGEYKAEKEKKVPTQKSLEVDKKHNTGWFPIEDEDYIVFCIAKDGAIRVGKDRNLKALSPASRDDRTPRCAERSARRRVNFDTVVDGKYAEVHGVASDCATNRDDRDATLTKEAGSIVHDEKGKEKCGMSTDTDDGESSTGSYNNNISSDDSSRSSFAFPVLTKDGVSSPARMPEPDDFLQFRNHKPGVTCPHCCRFN